MEARNVITLLEPGFLTTIQDGGRVGWARYGVPPSGPMDVVAFRAANALVGNDPGAAALEITLTGPTMHIGQECLIAVCGAAFDLWVGTLPTPTWHAVYVRPGQTVTFGARRSGMRAYFAISGGIALPLFLGSQATYLKGRFGGKAGRTLQGGDQLPVDPAHHREFVARAGRAWPRHQRPPYTPAPTLRVILGPQEDYFSPDAIATLLHSAYTITSASDRMGYRLKGHSITHCGPTGIASDGIVTGSIQIPPDGQPIVMMVDHQTTGGYPKIATVIQPDLPLLAQCLAGDAIKFSLIEAEEAQNVYEQTFAIYNT